MTDPAATEQAQAMADDASAGVHKRRVPLGIWIAALAIFIFGGGAAAFFLTRPPTGLPERVLIVTRFNLQGAEFDADRLGLANRFAQTLDGAGFDGVALDPQPALPPAGTSLVETLREFADEAGAAHALLLDVTIVPERAGIVRDSHLFKANLHTEVIGIDPAEETTTAGLEFTYEHALPLEIWRKVEDTWVEALGPEVVDQLYRTASGRTLLEGNVSLDSIGFSQKLKDGLPFLQHRRDLIARYENFCRTERQRLATLHDGAEGVNVSCVGDPCAQWALLGVSENGSTAYVQDVSRRPMFELGVRESLRWSEPPEALLAVHLGTGDARPIFRAGHFFGIGSLNEAQTHFAAQTYGAEDSVGLVSVDLSNGHVVESSILPRGSRMTPAFPSASGDSVLSASYSEWTVFRGAEKVIMPNYDRARWTSDRDGSEAIVGSSDRKLLWTRLDGSVSEPSLELEGSVYSFAGHSAGKLAVIVRNVSCELVMVDESTHTISSRTPLPFCVDDASILGDGRLVGTGVIAEEGDIQGDPEVVIIDPSKTPATARALTRGGLTEELPRVTRDGRKVVFNRRLNDWPRELDMRVYRRVVCSADLPPR